MVESKICPKCGEVKLAFQFYPVPSRADGLSGYCRVCQVADAKSRYNPHPRYRPPEGQKWCSRCKTMKAVEDFGFNKRRPDGRQSNCKPCQVASVTASRHKDPTSHRESSKRWRERNTGRHADNNAKRLYGIPHGTYDAMFAEQNGKCAICKTTEPEGNSKRFHIDHCHDTGIVRGLLCTNCNNGIGRFKHDDSHTEAATRYLRERRTKS